MQRKCHIDTLQSNFWNPKIIKISWKHPKEINTLPIETQNKKDSCIIFRDNVEEKKIEKKLYRWEKTWKNTVTQNSKSNKTLLHMKAE